MIRNCKYLLLSFFGLLVFSSSRAQDLDYLCDSVLHAVQEESHRMLQDLCPQYADLKTVYDSSDMDMLNYQVGLRQKELEFQTKRDMKSLKKWAKSNDLNLGRLEIIERHYTVQQNTEGYHFAYVKLDCRYRDQGYALHFVIIELNNKWFYGEGLRMELGQNLDPEEPNYDKIDRERDKRAEEREKARLKAEEEKKKAEEAEKRAKEKEAKEKEKEAERQKREEEKKAKEKAKEEARKKREEAKKAKEKAREEARKKREEEKERKAREREEEKKRLEEERKKKEEEGKEQEKKDDN